MRAGIVLTLVALAGALLAGCGSGEESGSARTVVAAFYPLAWAAARLSTGAEVHNLTPPGAEPHDLELSPRDVETLERAELVVYAGGGFMPALEDAVEGRENALDVLEGERLLEAEDEVVDPHVWLDPARFADVVRRVGERLGAGAAAEELAAELEELDAEFRAGIARCERRELVTSHAAFAYLADAYGLEQIPLTGVAPESEPSARELEALVEDVRESGATTVFFEPLVSSDLAETVAREAGVRTAVLNPLEGLTESEVDEGEDYVSVMRDNLAALRTALGCS